jgi:hypothetical protein
MAEALHVCANTTLPCGVNSAATASSDRSKTERIFSFFSSEDKIDGGENKKIEIGWAFSSGGSHGTKGKKSLESKTSTNSTGRR